MPYLINSSNLSKNTLNNSLIFTAINHCLTIEEHITAQANINGGTDISIDLTYDACQFGNTYLKF
jgi:hypothetical protein